MKSRDLVLTLTAAAAIALSCTPRDGADDSSPAEEPSGGIVAGLIVRDAETRKAIRATKDVKLSAAMAGALQLVVTKSRYRLDLMADGEIVKTYPVALGGAPSGAKELQGDGRTPEGEYVLIPHHPSPGFGECFYICYPNESDADLGAAAGRLNESQVAAIRIALRSGRRPPHGTPLGGLILLHGTMNRSIPGLTRFNWTDGCIAMENDDLRELLSIYHAQDRPKLLINP